jgi:hypothetical protein
LREERRPRISFVFCLLILTITPLAIPQTTPSKLPKTTVGPEIPNGVNSKYVFAFHSNFEDGLLDGWKVEQGAAPTVVSNPNFSGEPSLASNASSGAQIDYTNQNFVKRDSLFYFQVDMYVPNGSRGYFGLGRSTKTPVALVGVQDGNVVAGSTLKNLETIEAVPTGTVYPSGWVAIWGMVNNYFNSSSTMNVFVDATDQIAATVSVPNVQDYTGAFIETTAGTAYYTNIYVTTLYIPEYVTQPEINTVEGYSLGCCGSGFALPSYYRLSAMVTIYNWSVPQDNMQSWQINAGNKSFFDDNTCSGFFQLGFDFNTKGRIAPWYVNGSASADCEGNYFVGLNGFATPAGSVLNLTIFWSSSSKQISFTIIDETDGRTFNASVPYTGNAFDSALTQYEFEYFAKYPVADFQSNLVSYGYQYTPVGSSVALNLTSSQQFPYLTNAPTTWDLTYYNDATAGYQQIAT